MKLDRVTITGADESVDPAELAKLSKLYQFVEWGILFGGTYRPRFPTTQWVMDLVDAARIVPMKLSAHLCGHWVRDLVEEADFTFREHRKEVYDVFQRIQLNFHGQYHKAHVELARRLMESQAKQFIFQMDGANDALISKWTQIPGKLKIAPLFDTSGGAGVLPDCWPRAKWSYQGYAGGLSPENLREQLVLISEATGDHRVWIDVETRVRSDDAEILDMAKVIRFIQIASDYVDPEARCG